MDKLKEFILSQVAERNIDRETAKELLTELRTVPAVGQTASEHQDVAIIGLAGRFSAASDADQFWQFLVEGRECVRDFPASRKADMYEILRNPYYSEIVLGAVVPESDLDIIYSKSGYLDRIDQFDAGFFGIPPLEATYMDPHQRIALEVAYEALENAGYGGNVIKGTRTGVFLGRDQTNYSYYRMLSERHAMQLFDAFLIHLHTVLQHDGFYILKRHIGVERCSCLAPGRVWSPAASPTCSTSPGHA